MRLSDDAPQDYVAEDNIIGGNVILFGATMRAYLRGVVGENGSRCAIPGPTPW